MPTILEPVLTPDPPDAKTTTFNLVDLCHQALDAHNTLNKAAVKVADILALAYRLQAESIGMGVLDGASGIHRIAADLTNTQYQLLNALNNAGHLQQGVREFAQRHKISLAPPNEAPVEFHGEDVSPNDAEQA